MIEFYTSTAIALFSQPAARENIPNNLNLCFMLSQKVCLLTAAKFHTSYAMTLSPNFVRLITTAVSFKRSSSSHNFVVTPKQVKHFSIHQQKKPFEDNAFLPT